MIGDRQWWAWIAEDAMRTWNEVHAGPDLALWEQEMNPVVRRFQLANHESSHAVALHRYGYEVESVDLDREPGREGLTRIADYSPGKRDRRQIAVVARVGSLASGEPWDAPGQEVDRGVVETLRPAGLKPSAWLAIVEAEAAELLLDAEFSRALGRVADALLERGSLTGEDVARIVGGA